MAAFRRTQDDDADIEMMIQLHETIAQLLKTPGLAGIVGQLAGRDFRAKLQAGLASDAVHTLEQMGVRLPAGGKVVLHNEGDNWRVEIRVPLSGHQLVFGLDSFTGYFDELRAV